MLSVITVGPAIKGAVADGSDVIGHQIGAELIALVDRYPQLARLRLPGEANRIAHTAREDAMFACRAIDFPYRGTSLFVQDAVFAFVTVRPNRRVEL